MVCKGIIIHYYVMNEFQSFSILYIYIFSQKIILLYNELSSDSLELKET